MIIAPIAFLIGVLFGAEKCEILYKTELRNNEWLKDQNSDLITKNKKLRSEINSLNKKLKL